MKYSAWAWILGASVAMGSSLLPRAASACGGFFCSQTQGVNQAAERIVFADNGDGTVTAVIEIQYQGPADKFSWLLPISSVPQGDEIAVGSSLSLQRLQQATNPQYNLITRVEGECDEDPNDFPSEDDAGSAEGGGSNAGPGGGVTLEASGQVGSFEFAVISIEAALPEPADAAVKWLNDNEYDVPAGAPGLLGPYLMDGMYLLALKLQKGADAGSIRPIVLTYDASRPMIPIKLTAVAANDDMGVLTWVLADSQAVPKNYNALELNEARINWFNPNANYNDVVIAAADEAGGQGFVTEYAQPGNSLAGRIWFDFEQQDWESLKERAESAANPDYLLENALDTLSPWDGFWDVFREHITLPDGITLEEFQSDPYFYAQDCVIGPGFWAALEKDVVEPARVVQELLDARPQVTRLYSTLSAAEMTVDPLFTYNPDLEPVSNIHQAERIVECSPGYFFDEAPWRIELPQGGVVRGGPDTFGTWPEEFDDQPANRRILRQGESGPGRVLEDNGKAIDADVQTYSDDVPTPPQHPRVPADRGGVTPGSGGAPGNDGSSNDATDGALEPTGGCACSTAGSHNSFGALSAALLVGLTLNRRRRKQRQDAQRICG
jgi:MYXO-CTERM domain-containing protein